MRKLGLTLLGGILLAAFPAMAQDIPAGEDPWNTPGGGRTYFTIPAADLDSLCGPGNTDQRVDLVGVALDGLGNADTIVERLDNAILRRDGDTATVRARFKAAHFKSETSVPSTCGDLDFEVQLLGQTGTQPETALTISRDSASGGTFIGDLVGHFVFQASLASTGDFVGSLSYLDMQLTSDTPTPWSYNPPPDPLDPDAAWFPGVQNGSRVVLCRGKLVPAFHCYTLPKPTCTSTSTSDADGGLTKEPCKIDEEPVPTALE